MAEVAMTKAKELGSGESPPTNKQSPAKKLRRKSGTDLPTKRARRKTDQPSTGEGEVLESGAASASVEAVVGQFTDAIDLTGVSEALQQKLYAVAPVLRGRGAVYNNDFFCNVVGLSCKGVSVKKVRIDDAEILVKWPVKDSRYEIASCLDRDEAALFVEHWHKVYGGSPDNDYFPLRFLKACYATFVHGIDVNWVEEALEPRHDRELNWERNKKKLGPVALRQQIATICKVIADIEATPSEGMQLLTTAKDRLKRCKEDEENANNRNHGLLRKLQESKEALLACYAIEDSTDLNVLYSKAVAEAKSLRTTGNTKETLAKRAEVEGLLARMTGRSQQIKALEDAIQNIEEKLLPAATAEFNGAKESVVEAEERVKELTMCPGCLSAMTETKCRIDVDLASTSNSAPPDEPAIPVLAAVHADLAMSMNDAADAMPASSSTSARDEGLEPGLVFARAEDFCQCPEL